MLIIDQEDTRAWSGSTALPAKSQLISNRECRETPVAASAVKHNVAIVFPRNAHVELLLEQLRGQFQCLLQDAHWHSNRHEYVMKADKNLFGNYLNQNAPNYNTDISCLPKNINILQMQGG